MPKSGPIILVDDDYDDTELVSIALKEVGVHNHIIHFVDCMKAFYFLKDTIEQPFIILCDVNLPIMRGTEFKRKIDEDSQLRDKSIPFVFFSTSVDKKSVNTAFKEMTVQGYFQKPSSFIELKDVIKIIMDYWRMCHHPNS